MATSSWLPFDEDAPVADMRSPMAETLRVDNPFTGEVACETPLLSETDLDPVMQRAHRAHLEWRRVPVADRVRLIEKFVQAFEEIAVDYEPGTVQIVKLHDGPTIKLKKLERDYDPTSKWRALEVLEQARAKQELITGLLYIDESRPALPEAMSLTATPLAQLPENRLRPSREAFANLMQSLM